MKSHVAALSDSRLLEEVDRLARDERASTVALITALIEVDRRRLYAPAGYSSLFSFCTQRLRLSEGAAYARIEAARASQRFPAILDGLADGSLTLSTVGLIARHLTAANAQSLLADVRHKPKREVERVVAGLRPLPDVPSAVRKLPAHPPSASTQAMPSRLEPAAPGVPTAPAAPETTPPPRPVVAPLTPERFKLQITMSRDTHDVLRELQGLMRHTVPSGDAAIIVARALRLLRDQVLRQKAAQTAGARTRRTNSTHSNGAERPRPASEPSRETQPTTRVIPADVRRLVWARDDARCAFIGQDGRCTSREFLEFHHVKPFAAGGANNAGNIELRCRVHNDHEAEVFFGRRFEQPRVNESSTAPEQPVTA